MKLNTILLTFLAIFFLSCSSNSKNLETNSISLQKQHINLINGYATECMMDRFFRYGDNWRRLDGEYGRNGFDGLYIKEQNGNISDLLVTESKFNHARLGTTQMGSVKQMSKVWILATLERLKRYQKERVDYDRLIEMVQNGNYRARLFHLKPYLDDTLTIKLYAIRSEDGSVHKELINQIDIDFQEPRNSFERDMIISYNRCRREGLERWFEGLDREEIDRLLQKNSIDEDDI